jgi:hypothetical protein
MTVRMLYLIFIRAIGWMLDGALTVNAEGHGPFERLIYGFERKTD